MAVTRRFWWALAAGAVLIGGASAAWGFSHHGSFYDVSPGSVLVSADGHVITLADLSASCLHPAEVVLTESSSAVTIVERTEPDSPPTGCARAFEPDALTIRLRDPVGRRVLLDGTTGRPLRWFDQRRELRPTYLPAGFSAWPPDMPFAFPYLDVPQGAFCTQMFHGSSGWLAITQLLGGAHDSRLKAGWPGTVFRWHGVRVRGHRGWLAWDRLTWYEGGQSVLIVAGGRLVRLSGQSAPLLLAIARSLR